MKGARPKSPAAKASAPAPGRRVKASDVAREANVSTSAVSRAFTDGASVAPETRARVLLAANALGYRPNALARGLITQRTRLVAVIMANLESPFFSEFLDNLNSGLEQMGYSMLLLLIPGRQHADEALERARDYSVQGAVFLSTAPTTAAAERAEAAGMPLVILDRGRDLHKQSSSVWVNTLSIGRQVADRFIAEGRRRPLAISTFKGPQPAELASFCTRLARAGYPATRRVQAGLSYADGLEAGRQLFAGPDHVDAVFATTDALACGLFDAATRVHGLKAPEAISIVGVGDVAQTSWMAYGISTVHLPIAELARTAIDILAARIADPQQPRTRTLIDCEIVWRGSTLTLPGESVRVADSA